jgi:hypothetical protein
MTTRVNTDEMTQYLVQLIRELSAPRNRAAAPAPAPVPASAPVDSAQSMILQTLREIIGEYNQNIHDYQENMRRSIQILADIEYRRATPAPASAAAPIPTPSPAPATNDRTSPLSNSFIYRTIRAFIPGASQSLFQDIIVRPSQQQIADATRSVVYSVGDASNNTRCPITLEDFQDADVLTQIRHCGHSFRPTAIQNWFRSNVRCPICRFDIRDTAQAQVEDVESDEEEEPTVNTDTNAVSSIINTFYNPDADGAIFTFEFPITSIEASGNFF